MESKIDKYKIKENYITRNPSPEDWRNHPNGQILNLYSNIIKGKVFDFGCNHGAETFLICENENVTKVTGLDLNCDAIDIANKTKEQFYDCNINFICSNIIDFEINEKYDTIISFHTIEHIYPEDIDSIIKKLLESLNNEGYCIISIPYEHAYDNGVQHVAYYNENSLKEVFEKNGFKTIECIKDDRHSEGNLLTGIFIKK